MTSEPSGLKEGGIKVICQIHVSNLTIF